MLLSREMIKQPICLGILPKQDEIDSYFNDKTSSFRKELKKKDYSGKSFIEAQIADEKRLDIFLPHFCAKNNIEYKIYEKD